MLEYTNKNPQKIVDALHDAGIDTSNIAVLSDLDFFSKQSIATHVWIQIKDGSTQDIIEQINTAIENYDIKYSLQNAKEVKILELNTACNQTILGGFVSDCTDEEHFYKFDMEYQGNFAQQGVMLSLDPTIATVIWPTSDSGVLPHSREEFIQLCKDAQDWKATNIYRYFGLKAHVEACTEISQVSEFVW